jgi:thiamine pyrophosphate-dependent acetolactate synthase large subunit-like protein
MQKPKLYQALAEAFVAEGVDTQFILMGDGNMHWTSALQKLPGVKTVHHRHEHCAVAAAMGYYVATGKIAAASVTCGPGLTQLTTALPAAVRARIPVVVFAGESPINAKFYNQEIPQLPLVVATGAHYIQAHSVQRMYEYVREAFYVARHERRPVVLGVPYDLQTLPPATDAPYVPSARFVPNGGRPRPDPELVAALIEKIRGAKRPIIMAGRGVMQSGAKSAVEALADRCGAALTTTLPARGLYDHHPYSLGVSGGYATKLCREVMADADLIVAFGARMSYYTVDGGNLFPKAFVAQIDTAPRGLTEGALAANLFITADAKVTAEALLAELDATLGAGKPSAATVRTNELAHRIATELPDDQQFDIAPDVLDPRAVIRTLDDIIPKDWDIVSGSGHQAYFNSQLRGRPPEKFCVIREFGAIGNGLSYAIGVAAARAEGRNGKVVLIDGDGSLLMHIQELETLKRHGMRVLICVLNDGAYGAEIHKFRHEGQDDSGAIFGRPPFEAIAQGFGLVGAEVRDLSRVAGLFKEFEAQGETGIWNFQISDQVVAPTMRRNVARGHGKM